MSWLERLDAVEARLVALAARDDLAGLTKPDDATGEQWDAGQVWAHLAEFGDYWIAELDKVLAGATEFGRVKTDPVRVAAIAQHRDTPPADQFALVRASMARLRERLEAMSDADWARSSHHSTLGAMTVDDQLQHFHVGHYEEHAQQLETLQLETLQPESLL